IPAKTRKIEEGEVPSGAEQIMNDFAKKD
ncbi:hypothetical protein LCGC14_2862550, partial [marine sediment metagenome]